jgi:hypothetical protein
VECEKYRGKVFTHRRRTSSDREPSHQTGNGAADSFPVDPHICRHKEWGKDKENGGNGRGFSLRKMGKVVWDWEKNAETTMGLLLRIRGYLCEEEEKELAVGKGKWVE